MKKTDTLLLIAFLIGCFNMAVVAQTTINNGDCGVAIPIPDNNCVDVTINVTAPGTALGQDVFLTSVRVILAHDWRADVEMTLTTPSTDASLLLIDRRGGTGDNWGFPNGGNCSQPMVLSDEGCASGPISATNKSSASVGRYAPEENFADLYASSNPDPNGAWNLRICDQKSVNIGSLEYFEMVFEPVGCTAPTMVELSNISFSAVNLTWDNGGACSGNVVIEYGPVGFLPGNSMSPGSANSQVAVLNCTESYTLGGLTEVTEYDLYIRQSCGTFMHLYNSCKTSFLTDCNVAPVTLIEDFNNQINCDVNGNCVDCPTISGVWRNIVTDSVDWIVNSGPTGTSKTGPSDDVSEGGQYIYLESSFSCSENKEGILLSDCINVQAQTGICHLSFYYHLFGSDINQLKLEGTVDGATWVNLWQENGNQGDDWFKVYVDLAAYHDQVMQFRFVGNTTANKKPQGDIGLDHIEFYGSQVQSTDILYADKDGDGFGDANDSLSICFLVQPTGFVANKMDCDDTDATRNPNAVELPCNLVDENCNGDSDDALILNPTVTATAVCSGNTTTLQVNQSNAGKIYWFSDSLAVVPIDSGATFTTPVLMDTTIYYFQEITDLQGQSCQSTIVPVEIVVVQQPDISNASGPQTICQATNFDLGSLIIQDENNATDTILFYSSDTYSSNSLIGPNVSITTNTIYYIQAVSSGGCTDELSVSFTVDTSPIAAINTADTLAVCFQSSPQIIVANNTGAGTAPFDYDWNVGTQTQDVIVFPRAKNFFQTYSVTITSANGCSSTDSMIVHTLPSVSTVQIVDIQEPGFCQQNGEIQVAPQDGLAPYGYVWNGPSFGITNNSTSSLYRIRSLPMGAYNITVTDSYGCNKVLPQQIVNGPDLSIDAVTDVACNGESNGAINLSIGGLTNPTFQWIDATNSVIATGEDLLNVPAGVYNVIVDSDNTQPCPLDSIVIKEPPVLEVLNMITATPSCTGFQDGFIELNVAGGTPINEAYNFTWSGSLLNTGILLGPGSLLNNNKPTNLSPGSYDVTISDFQGCTATATTIINPTPALRIATTGIDPTCVGGDDGQLTVTASGGNAPYDFQWNDPFAQNTATAFALKTAIYDVTVTDVNGCERTARDTLFQPPGTNLSVTSLVHPSCAGASDGVVELFVNGGTAPYSYLWNTNSTGSRLVSVVEGFYSISVTDANACVTAIDSIELDAPEIMDVAFISIQNPVCQGVEDGLIDISINGGVAPHRYSWNIGTGNKNLRDLSPGTYFLTVTDDNNCRAISDTVILTAPQGIVIEDFLVVDSILCKDMNNGVVFMNVSTDAPGVNNYSFTWKDSTLITDMSNGLWLSSDFTTLTAGTYEIEITDNIGCVRTTAFTLTEPEILTIDTLLMESPSCNGNEDGSVVANVSGGTEPYFYSWTLPNNSVRRTTQGFLQDISGGVYTLQVIDANDCISPSRSFIIQEPSPIDIALLFNQSVGCSDPEKGIINIDVMGGQFPYAYEWSSGLTSRSINNLDAGSYTITTTDATECTSVESFTIEFEEEDALDIQIIAMMDKSCSNSNDGAVTVVVSGGLGQYQYNWSNGVQAISNDTMELTSLAAGNYNVSVVDANDEFLCRGVLSNIVISSGGTIGVNLDNFNNELACFGNDNGAYNISVNGGTAPYTYQWSNGSTEEDQANLPAGNYALTITDVNGCDWTSNNFFPTILGPDNPLIINNISATTVLCAGAADGRIDVTISGGLLPYQFNWNTGATTSSIQNLLPGDYSLTITDRNNCQLQVDTSIQASDQSILLELSTEHPDCNNNGLGSISTNVTCGVPPYTYTWNTGATTPNLENLIAGIYDILITDAGGGQISKSIELKGQIPMQLENALIDYRSCTGYISLDISGGISNSFDYTWRNQANEIVSTSVVATNLPAGTYSVSIIDANNCALEAGPFSINPITPITAITADVEFSAPSNRGTVQVESITGGTPPYSFLWLNEEGSIVGNDSIVRGLTVGNYIVRVTDNNGCEQETGQIVTAIEDIEVLQSFAVFPNPTNGRTFLNATFSESVNIQVELFDVLGKSVQQQRYESISTLQQAIDFSTQSTGIFYLKITIDEYAVIGRKVLYLR